MREVPTVTREARNESPPPGREAFRVSQCTTPTPSSCMIDDYLSISLPSHQP